MIAHTLDREIETQRAPIFDYPAEDELIRRFQAMTAELAPPAIAAVGSATIPTPIPPRRG